MIFAKIDSGKLIFCPRNGYVDGIAISNIDVFFKNNPDIAKKEGWLPVVFLEEPADNVYYIIKDDVIYELTPEDHVEEISEDIEDVTSTTETI